MEVKKERLIFGAFIATLGFFFTAAMGTCSKLISPQTSLFTILFFQNCICLLCTLPQIVQKGWSFVKTEKLPLHLVRDIGGIMATFCLFFSLKTTSLVTGMLLLNAAPLWVPLISFLWLRLQIKGYLWIGIILGFVGVLLILKPGAEILAIGTLAALLSGILTGVTLIAIHKLAVTEPTHRILFYYFLLGTIVTLPLALFHARIPSLEDFFCLLGIGFSTILGNLLITYAFKHGKASVLAPISYTAVVYSGILGWLIWNNVPDFFSMIGMILVFIGGSISVYFEKKNRTI